MANPGISVLSIEMRDLGVELPHGKSQRLIREGLATREPTPSRLNPGIRPNVPSLGLWASSMNMGKIGRLFHTIIQAISRGLLLIKRK